MAAPQASSRLEMLQARFQQKQLQEKEQKLLQLYDQQQQRAYQVVQRGSAGSNGSNHGSSISQHTITKTSSSSHTTSTSQGGKVRQMFDERRQTTVKGIDRSYPLEPLENKPRKQTNGNGVVGQKNGNLTVNRQSVTVKRVTRADVNSNLNGGKPIVSYHEEVSRESFGPSAREHEEEDEFGNENHMEEYSNGNHSDDDRQEVRIDEILDQDTMERNRMMAKLHMMEYDRTLKHRVKNDLESEEFPEDLMVDVPDKLPKRTVTKKLSQAEARLERFKNANAKRNNLTKNTTTAAILTKKRSEPILPAKSTSRKSEQRTRTQEIIDRQWNRREKSPRTKFNRASKVSENIRGTSLSSDLKDARRLQNEKYFGKESERIKTLVADSIENPKRPNLSPEYFRKELKANRMSLRENTGRELQPGSTRDMKYRDGRPQFFCRESEQSATTMKIDSKTTRPPSPDFERGMKRRSVSPQFFCRESEKSGTTMKIDKKTSRSPSLEVTTLIRRQNARPQFFCRESEKSGTAMEIDYGTSRSPSPESGILKGRRNERPRFFCRESEKSGTTMQIDSKSSRSPSPEIAILARRHNARPQFFCRESEKSGTTMQIDPKANRSPSPEIAMHARRHNARPQFFCRESEKSGTTMEIDSKSGRSPSPESAILARRRNGRPQFFCRESEKSGTTMKIDSKISRSPSPESAILARRHNARPQFFCRESEKSGTTMQIDPKANRSPSPEIAMHARRHNARPQFFCRESEKSGTTMEIDSKSGRSPSPESAILARRRNGRPQFFCRESEKSGTTMKIDSKISRSPSPESAILARRHNARPQFFCRESEKSGTTMQIDPKANRSPSPEIAMHARRHNARPQFFCRESEKSGTTMEIDSKSGRSPSPESAILARRRNGRPQFFCRESEKSGTTMKIDSKISRSPSPESAILARRHNARPQFFCRESEKSGTTMEIDSKSSRSPSPESAILARRHNARPQFFCRESEKSGTTMKIDSKISRSPSPESAILARRHNARPQFFCRESEKSGTTMQIDPKANRSPSPEIAIHARRHNARPQFFCRESEKSGTTMSIDATDRSIESFKPERDRRTPIPIKPIKSESKSFNNTSPKASDKIRQARSPSPQFFCRESEKSATTMAIGVKDTKHRPSKSIQSIIEKRNKLQTPHSPEPTRKTSRKSTTSPMFFCTESDRSATTMLVTPETITKLRKVSSKTAKEKPQRTTSPLFSKTPDDPIVTPESKRKTSVEYPNRNIEARKLVSQFFSKESDKIAANANIKTQYFNTPPSRTLQNLDSPRNRSPVSLKDMDTQTPRSTSPQSLSKQSPKPPSIKNTKKPPTRDFSTKSQTTPNRKSKTPDFFCYETEKHATTVSLKPKSIKTSSPGSETPRSFQQEMKGLKPKKKDETLQSKIRPSSTSPVNSHSKNPTLTPRTSSPTVLRSTSLIRDAINRQNKSSNNILEKYSTKEKPSTATKSNNASRIKDSGGSYQSPDNEVEVFDVKVSRRAATPPGRAYKLLTPDLSPKSFTSAEVDTEIQEITMPDQYVEREQTRGATGTLTLKTTIGETYSKSSDQRQNREKSREENIFTYLVRKPRKARSSLLKSNIFEPINKSRRNEGFKDPRFLTESKSRKEERSKRREENGVSLKGIMRGKSSKERRCSLSSTNESSSHFSKRRTVGDIVNRETGRKRETQQGRKQTRSLIKIKDEVTADPKRTYGRSIKKEDHLIKTSVRRPVCQVSKQRRVQSGNEILRSMKLVQKAVNGGEYSEADEKCKTGDRDLMRRSEDPEKNRKINPLDHLFSTQHTVPVDELIKPELKENAMKISNETFTQNRVGPNVISEAKFESLPARTEARMKDYERTDSVESALRRFDSIGAESSVMSLESVSEASKGMMKDKTQLETARDSEQSFLNSNQNEKELLDDSEKICLKSLDHQKPLSKTDLQKTSTGRTGTISRTGLKVSKPDETRSLKRSVKGRDTIDARKSATSPACKRRLFQDSNSEEEKERLKSKSKFNSVTRDTNFPWKISTSNKRDVSRFGKTNSQLSKCVSKGRSKKVETSEVSTSVKLRSIEDIRRSIRIETFNKIRPLRRDAGRSSESKSAIVNGNLKTGKRSELGGKDTKGVSLLNRSQSGINKSSDEARDSCVKRRFSRMTKSPSPDPASRKGMELSNRVRKSAPPSPSKSPDTVTRRPSTDLRMQDTRPAKRQVATKGTELIGNRKSTTATRKSSDTVDGTVPENDLHLRDQAAETKYDNDSPRTKKSDAFVIDFDEQPLKENEVAFPKKPLLRKQSREKQTSPTQAGRPPSSVSSVSSSSSVQGQISGSKGKMATRAKTPISGTSPSKGSPTGKSGGNLSASDNLIACKICGRRFAQERVTLHEQICLKAVQKKRKQFDTMMYRVRGTDLEPFVKKGIAKKQNELKPKKPEVKSNWRRKHEDFINAIRSAKQVQAHLAAGGKLSDLPPPPASDTSDYIQCPHCGRKFNQAAAERHIPKCEHMLHNKPAQSRTPKPRR